MLNLYISVKKNVNLHIISTMNRKKNMQLILDFPWTLSSNLICHRQNHEKEHTGKRKLRAAAFYALYQLFYVKMY